MEVQSQDHGLDLKMLLLLFHCERTAQHLPVLLLQSTCVLFLPSIWPEIACPRLSVVVLCSRDCGQQHPSHGVHSHPLFVFVTLWKMLSLSPLSEVCFPLSLAAISVQVQTCTWPVQNSRRRQTWPCSLLCWAGMGSAAFCLLWPGKALVMLIWLFGGLLLLSDLKTSMVGVGVRTENCSLKIAPCENWDVPPLQPSLDLAGCASVGCFLDCGENLAEGTTPPEWHWQKQSFFVASFLLCVLLASPLIVLYLD